MFRFIPDDTRIGFMRWHRICLILSVVGIVLSALLVGVKGLNFGIDFRGGTLIEVRTSGPAELGAMRAVLGGLGLGDVQLQTFGEPNDVLIRIGQQGGGEAAEAAAVQTVRGALEADFPGVTFRRVEFVGPKVSADLLRDGIYAVLIALVGVMIYLWLRFEWQYGVAAIAALVHDVAMTLGLFSLLGLEFNLSTVAAVLTIVGYSLNDTVVIFDRIRENLRRYKRLDLSGVIDRSINETLARTVVTSLTTLLALFALFFVGPAVIKGFTFAMIWGVFVGTYSTIFIAAPILLLLNLRPEPDAAPKVAGSASKA